MHLLSEHGFGAGGLSARHFRLENGLQIILVRDPGAPILAYQTWFSVGSRHEKEGTTGIAHLFEHLMFNQTETHPPGELDRLIESRGGDTNAATWVDWTYYRNNLPASELALAVELESDRMAHLVLGDKQVESEREVVANERRQRVEDDVDGFLSEELYKLAFQTHPYHWPTIGWMSDIQAITIDDCRKFYRTYYAPNNATVVLVGDFDEADALARIEKGYAGIPSSTIPVEDLPSEPEQRGERRARFAKAVVADKVRVGYKAPPLPHADYARLEVASEILCSGNSSRLHRRLVVDTELCSSVSAGLAPFRDPGLYELSLSMQRGKTAADGEALLYRELELFSAPPPTAEELTTAKTRLLTRLYRELRPGAGKAEALGHFHVSCGDYRRLFSVADAYSRVTAEEVQRVAAYTFDPARRTVLVAEPSGEDADEAEES